MLANGEEMYMIILEGFCSFNCL